MSGTNATRRRKRALQPAPHMCSELDDFYTLCLLIVGHDTHLMRCAFDLSDAAVIIGSCFG